MSLDFEQWSCHHGQQEFLKRLWRRIRLPLQACSFSNLMMICTRMEEVLFTLKLWLAEVLCHDQLIDFSYENIYLLIIYIFPIKKDDVYLKKDMQVVLLPHFPHMNRCSQEPPSNSVYDTNHNSHSLSSKTHCIFNCPRWSSQEKQATVWLCGGKLKV